MNAQVKKHLNPKIIMTLGTNICKEHDSHQYAQEEISTTTMNCLLLDPNPPSINQNNICERAMQKQKQVPLLRLLSTASLM